MSSWPDIPTLDRISNLAGRATAAKIIDFAYYAERHIILVDNPMKVSSDIVSFQRLTFSSINRRQITTLHLTCHDRLREVMIDSTKIAY
jgi:hypothetical protein